VRGPGGLGSVINNPVDDFTAQGSINLQWNLFEGRATEVAVEKSELAASSARVELLKSERQVQQDTEKAVRTLAEGLQALKIAVMAQTAATQGLTLAQERFRAGAASNLEVRDAQLKLTASELTLVSTQIDLHLADIDVRTATGKL
jgi:outer membrane protein